MRTNVLNDLSSVVKKGTILSGSAAAAVDSCAAGSTTLADYPGNHPVITQLSPRNHPLLDAIWKHVAMIFAVLVMSMANIGMAWGASGVINAASTTDLGKGNTPRYVVEQAGVGRLMKNATGSSSWDVSSGKLQTGSSKFALQTYNAISSIVITGYGTGGGRTFSSMRVGTTTDNYAAATATGTGTMSSTESSQTITITPSSTIAANSYVEITLSGNIYIYSVELVYASSCAATANAGADKSTTVGVGVAMAATAASSGYTGAWSIKSGSPSTATSQLSSTSSATATFTPTAAGTYTLVWTVTDNSDGTCSASDEATVTVTAPTHTVTATTDNASYGTAAAASGTVMEGSTTTITATPNSGYQFDHWTVSGTGASLSSTTTNPTTLTMGTANATVTAYFVEKTCPSSGTLYTAAVKSSVSSNQSFPASATTEVSPTTQADITGGQLFAINGESSDKNLIANSSGYKFCMTNNSTKFKLVLECELQAGDIITIDGVGGTKNDAPIGLWVSSSDSRPGSAPACSGTSTTTSLVDDLVNYTVTSSDEYHGKSILYIHRAVGTSTYFNNINISRPAAPSCTAPNHVDISGRWDRFGGETISLTATAYSSEGTGSPIAAGSITGHQWQKLIGTTWTDVTNGTSGGATTTGATSANLQITNCTKDNSGKYRCVVSTGTTCSTASATATDGSQGFGVKVYVLECYTGGTTEHHFTRTGDSQAGTLTMNLTANTAYTFKVHADNTYYGNNGTINKDETNWVMCNSDNGDDCAKNLTVNSGLGGTFTFGMEYSTSGSSSVEGEPEISVTYPRKTIYLVPNSDWLSNSAKFAFHYYGTSGTGWTDFLTSNDCGMSAEIPQWNGLNVIAVRFNPSDATPGWNGDGHVWNQTADIAATADKNCVTITDWNAGTYGTYSTPTYTISYNKGTNGTGSKANESKTCGVDFTLPGSTFTYAGHTQDGWATADGGAIAYALSGSYTTNAAQEFFPHWKCNTPTITDNGDNTVTITVPAGTTVRYTTDGTNPTSSTGTVYSSAIDIAANVTVKAIAYQSGCTDSEIASQACTYHAPVASQTALVINTLYEVPDMIPSGATLTDDDQFFEGLSANTKFELIGSASSSKTPKANSKSTNDKTIDGITFDDGSMWFKGTASLTSNIPTTFGLSFIVPSAGKLYLYFSGTSTNIKLAKSGEEGSKPSCPNGYGAVDVTAGTYYLYGTGTTAPYCFYGLKLCSTYSVSITTNNTTKTSGETGSTAAVNGKAYTATFTANTGYTLPSDVTVTIGGVEQTKGTGYTWTISDGTATLTIPAAKVTGNIVVTVTGTAAATYALNYECNGAESGCPSNTTASALPNPLPSAPTKDGYTFGGWYTDEELTVSAVAGATMTEATTLYAKWTVNSSSECITITNFATSNVNNTCGDGNGKIFYGYKGSVSDANALTITSNDGNDHGQNSGAEMRLTYNKLMRIYANNTTNAAPATFSNVTSVSFKWKFIASGNSGNTELTSSYTVKVGSTTIANAVSITGKTKDGYQTVTIDNLAQLSGYVEIKFSGSSSSYNVYIDDIEICTASMSSCTTPVLPTLADQGLCVGADISEWNATVTNAAAIEAAGETVAYSWKKKGNATELANTASFDLGASAAESQAGTYVVTVTVSKAGYASATATKEVTLTVNEATEVTAITADKATVYPTNSVTLTATANMDATWKWYTCTNAEGEGEVIISGATSASYTIASAPAAGTYYYKAEATGSCGTDEMVYTLTVSAASECQNYYWFIYADDATANGVINNRDGFFSNTTTGTGNTGTYTMTVDGTSMTGTKRLSTGAYKPKFTVPDGATATLYIYGKAASSDAGKHLVLKRTSDDAEVEVTSNTTVQAYTKEDIEPGEWTLSCGSSNWCYSFFAVKVCSASSCTDATPTITAANTTVCVGSELSISSTGYETGATFQWQKLNGSAWDNISGATNATYTVATAAAEHAGSYRLVATKGCARTSNTVTIAVPSAPVFNSFTATRSVMATLALSITDVEASDATSYAWYKSADATYDAGSDTKVGTSKELLLASGGETAGTTYYLFCVASNSCGSTTSGAITVNVTAFIEEDCATRGNEGDAEFGFVNTSAGQGSYQSTNCWTMNSNSKYLTYTAPEGKYFKTAKVTIASSSENKASYNWSTNGGTSYTAVSLTVNSTLTERTINLSAHGNVNAFQIGRNFDSKGSSGGTLYVSKICFEYIEACTATTVTPIPTSKTYEMDGSSFTEPTFTVKHGGTTFDPQPTLTYSSSNEDIASVDDDGTVTFNGEAGTVTITASYAGDETYCASTGSYTITVSCPGGAPKVVASGSVDMSGCNSSVTLLAKTQADGDFADGTYQWFRNGEEIDGATSSSYTATQAGTYTVERTNTSGCTTPSTNSAIVTSETTEPEVERLVPFQYYHVDKTYSDQMKMRHLFAVKNSGTLDGKHFKMYVSCNGGAATDVTSSNALVVVPNGDGHVDIVMVDLNKLSGKYNENDELVYTCKAIDCSGNVSDVYKNTITMRVIGTTPTLALICSGSNKASGTRKTSELTVGGDFLTGYNKADLCQQTGNTSFDANAEWGLYTRLKENYIVTPVNGYAVFNKLNYEPFDILLLTDYPKSKKSEAAQKVIDDMAELCDYRPLLSFKTHMRQVENVEWDINKYTKWVAKGFTTSPVVTKEDGRLNLNIVCYAHPMFEAIKTGDDVYDDVANPSAPLVYTMLTGEGYEGSKGMQGFEIAAAENFVTIGLTHYNATIAKDGSTATWTPGSGDRMLVTVAERQTNIEARMILFSLNCGAQSKLTDKGEKVVLKCLEYLLDTNPLHVADCSFTFDNGASNEHNDAWYSTNCSGCTGTKGDGKWSTAANWAPDYRLLPGEFTSVRIKKPVEVDMEHAHVMSVRILEEGQITIPAGKALDVKSTIRRMDGTEISPTDVTDIHIGSGASGNGTLIFNNNDGDTKARVDMYSNAPADIANMSAATSKWQYIGTPHTDVTNARSNYYGSWLYQYSGSGWEVIPNGGPLEAFRGYCITNETAPIVYDMAGTLAATTTQDIAIPAGYTVIANSWVAPIDINAITDDDMENISDKTIYFFNTGTDAKGEHGTGTAAGTYRATPIHSASYTGDWQIPSMQGFYISTSSAGTFHLDYDRHVRPTGSRSVVSKPMYAPRRAKAEEEEEPAVLKIFARGSRYQDKLVVLEREDFTRGYDSGWDGEAWGGSDLSPMVYVTGEGREDAVSAIPEFEGTVIAFKAGEDDAYTLHFEYLNSDEPLYLFDTENNTYTQIMTGESYYFSTDDKAPHSRFILTRRGPQIATGVGEVPSDQVQGTKAKKLLIENKMYILLNGALYDATGKAVK